MRGVGTKQIMTEAEKASTVERLKALIDEIECGSVRLLSHLTLNDARGYVEIEGQSICNHYQTMRISYYTPQPAVIHARNVEPAPTDSPVAAEGAQAGEVNDERA